MIDFQGITSGFVSVAFVLLVFCFRDFVRAIFLPKLMFSHSRVTQTTEIRAVLSKWVLTSSRLEFYFKRDWIWSLVLIVCTTLISMLPITGAVEPLWRHEAMTFFLILLGLICLISIGWWMGEGATGTNSILKNSFRMVYSGIVVISILVMIGLGSRVNSLGNIVFSFSDPISVVIFGLIGFLLLMALHVSQVEAPVWSEGWGVHDLVRMFFQTLVALVFVTGFVGQVAQSGVLIFFENVLKVGVLLTLMDAAGLFVPKIQGHIVDRTTLFVTIPLGMSLLALVIWGLK